MSRATTKIDAFTYCEVEPSRISSDDDKKDAGQMFTLVAKDKKERAKRDGRLFSLFHSLARAVWSLCFFSNIPSCSTCPHS